MLAVVVHGFNDSDKGKGSIDLVIPYLKAAGFEILNFDYGDWGLFDVRFNNDAPAKELARILNGRECVTVAHSNGNLICDNAAAKFGANILAHAAIAPAMDKDRIFARSMQHIDVYYNKKDWAVFWASLLWFNHPWGKMGRVGFIGTDRRVTNINTIGYTPFIDAPGHSNILPHLAGGLVCAGWGQYMAGRLANAVGLLTA